MAAEQEERMKYRLRVSRTAQPTLTRIIISALLLMTSNSLTIAQNEQQPSTAKDYVKRGLAFERKGDLDRAIKDYSQAIKLAPDDPDGYNNRGLALLDKRKFDEAIVDFTKIISLRPQEAKYYFNRGLAYLEKGVFDSALPDFNQAISLNPQLSRLYLGRAQAYRKLGKTELAEADERKSEEIGWQVAEAKCKRAEPPTEAASTTATDSTAHEQTAAAMLAGLQSAGLRLEKKIQSYSTTVDSSAGKLPANASQGQMLNFVLMSGEFQYVLLGIKDDAGMDSDQWFRSWVNELKRLDVIPKGDPMQLGIAIRATPGLYDLDRRKFACTNNELVAVRNLKRLRSISPELLRKWHAALTAQEILVRDLVLVHLLIAQDALFEGPNVQEDRSQRALNRLQLLPKDAVKAWTETTGYPRLDAVFSLLTVHSLFSDESFMTERFAAALPLAQKVFRSKP
jgi:Flp pilus assembly protein TadD